MSKIGDLRRSADLSQSELARKSGISVRVLQEYEQGRRSVSGIGLARACALAHALGVHAEDLLEEGAED